MKSKIASAGAGAAEDDYPCVRRLRHRRLLGYLHNQGFEATFHSVIQELGQRQHAVFSAAHLRKLVAEGRWGAALSYVRHFLSRALPPGDVEASALILFLAALGGLTNTATTEVIPAVHHRLHVSVLTAIRGRAKPSSHVTTLTMLNSPLYRAYLDWEVVKREASSIAHDLALESPELSRREVLRLPAPVGPHDGLLSIFCPCSQKRPHVRKQGRRPTASAIAKLCLGRNNKSNKKTSPPSSSGPLPGSATAAALDRAIDLTEKCLKAGNRPKLHQGQPLQSTAVQGYNKEEPTCILYVQNHCRLNPNTVLVNLGGYLLQAQYLKCLTIDKTHDGREKFIPTNVLNAYIKIISRRRINCVLSRRFLVYDLGWAQDIPSIVNGDVSRMRSVTLLDHAKSLIQSELIFLPMSVENHMIVLVVNNKGKQFQVLDSAMTTHSRYQSHINDTISGIKNLLEVARSRGLHDVPDVTNWPVNQIYHIPPQQDGCSCSLFALKYIELWDGERLSRSFNQSDIHSFRVQVLVELLLSDLNVMNDVKSELRRLLDQAK